jgi:hypothetical protein
MMQDNGFQTDLLKPEREGKGVDSIIDADDGSNSPSLHWPQKAVAAHAATATSNGELRSKWSMSWEIILALTGGRGGRLEPRGARL